ncbi:hypothetical protein M5E86_19320 [Blautia wexlerae]|nr:hypothetical protein M5E86_19320 [Blautia wexlerae]
MLLLLGFMVAFPVAELMLIGNQTDEIHRMTFAMICSYLIVPGFLVTMLAAVVNALNEFWYLFSRDKIDFYHSLPVTRSRFFWEKSNQRFGAVSGSICDHGTDHNGDRSQQRTW